MGRHKAPYLRRRFARYILACAECGWLLESVRGNTRFCSAACTTYAAARRPRLHADPAALELRALWVLRPDLAECVAAGEVPLDAVRLEAQRAYFARVFDLIPREFLAANGGSWPGGLG